VRKEILRTPRPEAILWESKLFAASGRFIRRPIERSLQNIPTILPANRATWGLTKPWFNTTLVKTVLAVAGQNKGCILDGDYPQAYRASFIDCCATPRQSCQGELGIREATVLSTTIRHQNLHVLETQP
jgi:hypothetical protein